MSYQVKLVRQADDPICCRASIGGTQQGYYCVYRNDLDAVITAVKAALCALEGLRSSEHLMAVEEEVICLIEDKK